MEFAISQPKNVRLPWNEKQTYRMNSRPQMWPMGFTLAMTLIFEFSRSDVNLDLWPYAWCWLSIFMVQFWNSCISEWEGRVILNKGGGSRSLMTMTLTIWWPRSGERIYHIVTGVTSDIGVPSTRLVDNMAILVLIMAWHKTGNNLKQCWYAVLMHIYVTLPQWVKQFLMMTKAYYY